MSEIEYGLSIDPGLENGACLFSFSDEQPFKQEQLFQFGNGAEGLTFFLYKHNIHIEFDGDNVPYALWFGRKRLSMLVVEKFTPRDHDGFSLTSKSVEPLRGEGVLLGQRLGRFITWQQPSAQYFIGDPRLPLEVKKKASREFLKLHGIYPTGKTVGRANADDAISAELHAIARLRKIRHQPTLEALFPEEGE